MRSPITDHFIGAHPEAALLKVFVDAWTLEAAEAAPGSRPGVGGHRRASPQQTALSADSRGLPRSSRRLPRERQRDVNELLYNPAMDGIDQLGCCPPRHCPYGH
ncbi:hypothetical protein ACWGK6_20265 [Streptomyces violaceusniger]